MAYNMGTRTNQKMNEIAKREKRNGQWMKTKLLVARVLVAHLVPVEFV
jgi:hypothetical protein